MGILAAVLAVAVLYLTGCASEAESGADQPSVTETATEPAASATTGACLHENVFSALSELRRIQALCPTWLPAGIRPTQIFANDSPEYAVEFNPPGELFPHVVLQLAHGDPPGQRIGEADVNGRHVAIFFEPSRSPAGRHSGHFIAVIPGGAFQRGSYWVSIHQDSQRSRQSNIEMVLRIARALRPVS